MSEMSIGEGVSTAEAPALARNLTPEQKADFQNQLKELLGSGGKTVNEIIDKAREYAGFQEQNSRHLKEHRGDLRYLADMVIEAIKKGGEKVYGSEELRNIWRQLEVLTQEEADELMQDDKKTEELVDRTGHLDRRIGGLKDSLDQVFPDVPSFVHRINEAAREALNSASRVDSDEARLLRRELENLLSENRGEHQSGQQFAERNDQALTENVRKIQELVQKITEVRLEKHPEQKNDQAKS